MASSPSLALRAAVAVALMIGFYALAITVAGLLLYLPYLELTYARRIHLKLVVFCVVGAGLILWSILPRRDRFVAPGPLLEFQRHPKLLEVLRALARATGQQMPSEVYLVPEVNAWVAQRGGVMGFGSRRVMGLGLPLLQIVTVSELRAVLAHEFGHYYGGDTKLGPWVYKTRNAIRRTIRNLAERGSWLMHLFLWYGKLFLRITHAISRRQELAADELASRTVGSRALADGLRKIHGEAAAYPAYWSNEVAPVLGAGFRPPLAAGFARFLACAGVARAVSEKVEQELKEGRADAYDTHPALRERLLAIEKLPTGATPDRDPPAITLVENLDEMETRLLAHLADEAQARALKPVDWGDVGRDVYLPMWQGAVNEQADALAGLTPAALPELVKDPAPLAARLRDPKGVTLAPEERARRALWVLAVALTQALKRNGWELHVAPGEETLLVRGQSQVRPFEAVQSLASGELGAEAWQEQCAAAGISNLDLGAGAEQAQG